MNRAIASLGGTLVGVLMIVTFKVSPEPGAAAGGPRSPSSPVARATATPASVVRGEGDGEGHGGQPAPTAAPTAPRSLPSGASSFTGPVVRTQFGDIQVKVAIDGGKIVDVQALQLPYDRARSQFISQQVGPWLRSEAITAQSAQIDVISGATYTSLAYARSLDGALKQAHIG